METIMHPIGQNILLIICPHFEIDLVQNGRRLGNREEFRE